MAKKSSAARQSAARRTQTATRSSNSVLLVRPSESATGAEETATAISATPVAKAVAKAASPDAPRSAGGAGSATRSQANATKPVAAPRPAVATKPAPVRPAALRPVAPRPTVQANAQRNIGRGGKGMTAREQEIRLARARAMQRTRAANMITPEHYSYVLGDLRLILGVAAVFVAILVVLHFTLPQ